MYTDGLSEWRGGTSKFYLGDILGSVGDITDSTGSATTTDSTAYDSFGNVMAHSGTTPNPFAYCGRQGYQTDAENGLLLLGNRFYSPAIGRFISRDPAGAGDNWYAYCGNNPISNGDPTGLDPTVADNQNGSWTVKFDSGSTDTVRQPDPNVQGYTDDPSNIKVKFGNSSDTGSNVRQLSGGRIGYWDDFTGTVVIRNPAASDMGTAFQPTRGILYFYDLR